MNYEDPSATLQDLSTRIVAIRDSLDFPTKLTALSGVEKQMAAPDFWGDPEAAKTTVQRLKSLKAVIEPVRKVLDESDELAAMLELLAETDDAEVRAELDRGLEALCANVNRVELLTLLCGPDDARNCFFNIQAGTGGADACDWAQMLLRLYLRYFERNDYGVEELSLHAGEEAGIQSCSLLVKGAYAYGYMSCEIGVHRLVRISPFSAQGKRETSFASVDVQPELDDIAIEIEWDVEVREDTYRASGAGGQHVNKTSSAVRLTHLQSGIVAQCQSERSQHKNRGTARKMLLARLYQMEQAKRDTELAKVYSEKGQIGWGNAIRSYFLYPEQRVKDARTAHTSSDTQGILDGDIQPFIDAELRRRATARHK
ncbi:MAG: peptide chain release factor 2 [Planctomycetes bacterium]|nr:peptide chain release factor 2 [Planctomycetota bacterium]